MNPMSDHDGFTITCARCQQTAPLTDWIAASHGPNEFICPDCGHAFRRQPVKQHPGWGKYVELVPLTQGAAA